MTARKPVHLLYRVVEEAVFAPADIARRMDRVFRAIEASKTWGGLARRMPKEDYEQLMRQQFDEDGEPRPPASARFESTDIGGYADGDYPIWLQAIMDQWLPVDLLKKYASKESTMLSGSYWAIAEENVAALVADLRARGFVVTEASELEFR